MNNEDREFLKSLQQEMLTQDTVCQASPRFWVVADYRMVPRPEGRHESYQVYSAENEYSGGIDKLLDEIKECDLEDMPDEAKDSFGDIGCEVSAIEWLKEHWSEDAELVPVEEEHFICPNTLFLTMAEAKEHIRRNHYHYSKRAHAYAMTAWRSPQIKRLFEILEKTDWAQEVTA